MSSSQTTKALKVSTLSDPEQGTTTHQASFTVSYQYPVVFTRSVLNPDNPMLAEILSAAEPARVHRALVMIDEGVIARNPTLIEQWQAYAEYHSSKIKSAGNPIIVPGGERAKNDLKLQDKLSQHIEMNQIDRHSFVIAIGGGSMLDAVGLAAATAHRGVRLVRLPTTVLAQNDAGIGVKNGINRFGQKNWFGTFSPPFAVINDEQFLQTLNSTDRRAGMSEAVKVALIKDAEFFDWIESNTQALARGDTQAMRHLIEHCAKLHLEQITGAGDPFERGTARPLDFGHWAAHKMEQLSSHRIKHGDAVAIGIALDCQYAQLTGLLGEHSSQRVVQVLKALGFELYDPVLDTHSENGQLALLNGLNEFRRHLGGELSITLLKKIGEGVEVHTIDHRVMTKALSLLKTTRTVCE